MKRSIYILLVLFLALPLLSACAEKAGWLPLWTPLPPGSTPVGEPAGGGPADRSDEFFTTDAESMENPRIIVNKSEHALELYDGETLMARMKVALGRAEGAKKKSLDNKTPEGIYFICKASDEGRYYKSLFFSYPNSDDAYAGLDGKLIEQEQYDEIVSAIDRRQQPLWDTKLGGEIAISGTGTAGKDKTDDWTAGNIALSDKDMDYLWKYVGEGVDVEINP